MCYSIILLLWRTTLKNTVLLVVVKKKRAPIRLNCSICFPNISLWVAGGKCGDDSNIVPHLVIHIYILGGLDNSSMQQMFDPKLLKSTKCEDSALGVMLQEESLLKRVLNDYQSHSGSLTEPMDFCQLLSASVMAKGNPGSTYNEHICFKFHQFLVETFLDCVRTLEAFVEAMRNHIA
jgi:hypothetical protein